MTTILDGRNIVLKNVAMRRSWYGRENIEKDIANGQIRCWQRKKGEKKDVKNVCIVEKSFGVTRQKDTVLIIAEKKMQNWDRHMPI